MNLGLIDVETERLWQWLWPYRTDLSNRAHSAETYAADGLPWYEYA